MTAANDGWDPAQYNRFAFEREQPFWDLARLLQPVESPASIDLGCGDGRLSCHPVRGELFINGQPAHGAKVYFFPVEAPKDQRAKGTSTG